MANYHLEISTVSRRHGQSVTRLANYITGECLHDDYLDTTFYTRRSDVLDCRIFQPSHAPDHFHDLQGLCTAIEQAEKRWDARTARQFKGSLPNELPLEELRRIVAEFIGCCFLDHDLCAIAAIHEGRNQTDPTRNNPHAHIIVPTRTIEAAGFSCKKDRESDKLEYIHRWRERWAVVQNAAYERNGLDVRVSHESLRDQGINRLPIPHLSRIDWQKERRGERPPAGDRKREIEAHNRTVAHSVKRNMSRKR